ncbi:Predicted esterase [Burkholderia sp. OK233]|nr:Predicted esterase [Burkholderia sp. OK233]
MERREIMFTTRWLAPTEAPRRAVVFLHGRAQSAPSAQVMARRLSAPDTLLVLPEAPSHSWYPGSFLAPSDVNERQLKASLLYLEDLIGKIVQTGIRSDAITLAGFSQGAALASEFVGRSQFRYQSLIAFTGARIGPWDIPWADRSPLNGMPMHFSASIRDLFVPFRRIKETVVHFAQRGAVINLLSFDDSEHEVREEEYSAARLIITKDE